MRYNKYYTLILTFLSSLLLTGCTDAVESLFSDNIEEGEEVMFTTYLSENKVYSRAEALHDGDSYTLDNAQYSPAVAGYKFNVKMYEKTENAEPTLVGSATYSSQDKSAVLKPSSLLYWPSTQKKYAFEATAGDATLSDKQTTPELVQNQDLLHGYAFEPTITNDEWTDNLNALNFHTPAEWSKINKQRGISDSRQIPLFIRHQRAMITVVLKAYNTYDKKKLAFENYGDGKSVIGYINSYDAETSAETKINPYAFKQDIIYGSNTEKTIAYQAVVEPHNYLTKNDVLTEVKIAGSRYRFRPSNDYKTDETAKNAYNLQAGQHLIITATIGNDSRQISITAQIEDWDAKTIKVSRDDFGNSGLQMKIPNKAKLIEFLNSTKYNVPGAVGIVTATSINLDEDSVLWESNYDLKATLNVAGATLCTSGRLLNNITSTGSLQNAKIKIPENVSLTSAVAKNNSGVINLVSVNAASTATATVAGLVDNNDKGIITNCSSNLHVYGDGIEYKGKKYVGGIAGVSHSQTEGNAIIAAIDGCKVDARVDGTSTDVYGGGIAGYADGHITNNTFEYGITLQQAKDHFKNITADYSKEGTVSIAGNSWSTKDTNICDDVKFVNNYTNPYDAVIDRQSELAEALTKYNLANKRYRLADNFTLTNWTTIKDVTFILEGNNKTIDSDGMLFHTVSGKVSNLTVKINGNLIAKSNDNNTDAIAPFAYAVSGEDAEINNIKVKMTSNNYVQAANPSGLVVWAEKGAKIINCQSNAHVVAYLSKTPTNGASFLVGGIVSNANNAEISGCSYHADNSTLYQRVATGATKYDKVFFGGILGGINSTHEITLNDGNITDYDVLIKSCNSWFIPAKESVNTGTIVGYSVYNNNMLIDTNCQGNWWKDTTSPTIGNKTGSVGTRNSVAPSLGNHTDYNK